MKEETKKKISETNKRLGIKPPNRKGIPISKETRSRMSEAKKGKNFPNWGGQNPEVTKEKIRMANLGKKHSKETKLKIGKAFKGKKLSEAHRRKMSEAHKGKLKTGGRTVNADGYVYIFKPNHPYACKKGYIAEHRLVAEKALGRYLKSNEVPHHINLNTSDNRNSNLLICTVGYNFWLHREIKKLGLVDYFKGR